MSWTLFALSLLAAHLAQAGVINALPFLILFGQSPIDLYAILTVIYAMTLTRDDARLSGAIIGLAKDLGTTGPVGPFILTYGLCAWIITLARDDLRISAWYVRIGLPLFGMLPAFVLHGLYVRLWIGAPHDVLFAALVPAMTTAFIAAVVTGSRRFRPSRTGRNRGRSGRDVPFRRSA